MMDLALVPARPLLPTARRFTSWRPVRVRRGAPPPEPPGADTVAPSGRVVTVTAPAGTPGAAVAARVADALGLPLLDAAIPERVAHMLDVPVAEAQAMDGVLPSRFASALVWGSVPGLTPELDGSFAVLRSMHGFGEATRDVIRAAAASPAGAVVVGRGAAFELARHPAALHVLLTAPRSWREDAVGARAVRDLDRAHARYVRALYGADVTDRGRYGLVVDASVLDVDAMAEVVVVEAARRQLGPHAGVA
jgi:cytidylate kinase